MPPDLASLEGDEASAVLPIVPPLSSRVALLIGHFGELDGVDDEGDAGGQGIRPAPEDAQTAFHCSSGGRAQPLAAKM